MNKISIITINYNDKEGLKKTIESVLNQSFTSYEYIVIDGNSSDGSKNVIEEYKRQITYSIIEPDSGIYNAMNKGIRVAKGDYLLFLNSGDILYEIDTLSKIDKLIDGNYDIYYGDLICLDLKSNQMINWIFPNKLTFNFFIEKSLPHQASFIKKSLFDTLFYYNENLKIASDWEFFVVAICLKNASYKHIRIIVSEYDFTGISSNIDNYDFVQSEKKLVFDKYFSHFVEDYKLINVLESKRMKNICHLKQFKIPWELLKFFSRILMNFVPKPPKQENLSMQYETINNNNKL